MHGWQCERNKNTGIVTAMNFVFFWQEVPSFMKYQYQETICVYWDRQIYFLYFPAVISCQMHQLSVVTRIAGSDLFSCLQKVTWTVDRYSYIWINTVIYLWLLMFNNNKLCTTVSLITSSRKKITLKTLIWIIWNGWI